MVRKQLGVAIAGIAVMSISQPANACGGFFCQIAPINQAAEQIVFHQQGDDITAMVRILYQGDAEDFSWVVPVPNAPALSVGSDTTFIELDGFSQPQFDLETRGEACEAPILPASTSVPESTDDVFDGDVTVVDQTVGPFDTQTITSSNPDALATWLSENNYDIGDRGASLIAPYVEAGMKFVALKLRNGETSGSIQPLIMKYKGTTPTIPIRLTAVAAQDDMGVLVWVVGDSRAVPDNYLHVTPNYARLNWYTGTFNAYASYQTLITDAMNAAGGQGFATDMAGPITADLTSRLTKGDRLESSLMSLDEIQSDAEYIVALQSIASTAAFFTQVQSELPLPAGQVNDGFYLQSMSLQVSYTPEELAIARTRLRQALVDIEIQPLKESTALLAQGRYMTRLYTTLSAAEMTVDPTFVYNSEMPEQSAIRQAQLDISCGDNGTEWTLTLGAGTGRDGEKVIDANSSVPFGAAPTAVSELPAVQLIERTSADALPEVTTTAANSLPLIINGGSSGSSGGSSGSLGWWWIVMGSGLLAMRQKRYRNRYLS